MGNIMKHWCCTYTNRNWKSRIKICWLQPSSCRTYYFLEYFKYTYCM